MRALALIGLVASVGGCFLPDLDDGRIACGELGLCPSGTTCAADGRCRTHPVDLASSSDGLPPDLAVPGDSGLDSGGGSDGAPDLAHPCGGPYQDACAGGGCFGGGCLDTAICLPSGAGAGAALVCLAGNEVTCGGDGMPCCANDTCTSAGACCAGGVCVASGQSCGTGVGNCNGGSCANCGGGAKKCCAGGGSSGAFCTAGGLTCDDANDCVACGGPGQSCCMGNTCSSSGCCSGIDHKCIAAGSSCGGGGGSCEKGGCEDCGALGQKTCPNGVGCTAPSAVDAGGICVACGGAGQPCCRNGWCGSPYACSGGTCAHCGAAGEPCCEGRFCSPSLACNSMTLCR